jgi:hypothetical protein
MGGLLPNYPDPSPRIAQFCEYLFDFSPAGHKPAEADVQESQLSDIALRNILSFAGDFVDRAAETGHPR